MDILAIFLAIIIAMVAISLVILYIKKGNYAKNNLVFFIIALLAVVISWLASSALPDNYMVRRLISIAWGVAALVSVVLKKNDKADYFAPARTILTVALIGGLFSLLYV